jgi:hypothetical protein
MTCSDGDAMNIASVNSTAPVSPADLPSARVITEQQRTLIRAVGAVNASGTFGANNEVTYSVDRAAGMVVVKLVNKAVGEWCSKFRLNIYCGWPRS